MAEAGQAPELFNPDAAANWSLLFTPIFGSYLHWQNWKALGQNKGLGWFIGSLIAIPTVTALSFLGTRVGLIVLLAWYFSAARPQAKYVKERWGKDYPRRSITKAVLVAFAIIFVPLFLFGMLAGSAANG